MGQYTSYANKSSATVTFNEKCNALFAQPPFMLNGHWSSSPRNRVLHQIPAL
jgi:hypothetical protein